MRAADRGQYREIARVVAENMMPAAQTFLLITG
jgi:hypothetical protein